MHTLRTVSVALGIIGCTSIAGASLIVPEDPNILVGCENAQIDIYWVGSNTALPGQLSWLDPNIPNTPLPLFSTDSAAEGQHVTLPGSFTINQRLDFTYEITDGATDLFSTVNESDWAQFSVDATDPHDVIVSIDDVRHPDGDGDLNDAVFRVVCSHPVPTPGSLALLGTGGLLMGRRRR